MDKFREQLDKMPFQLRYYVDGAFSPPTQQQVYGLLDSALFADSLLDKPSQLVRPPSHCGKKFAYDEAVYSCDCGRDNNCLLWFV